MLLVLLYSSYVRSQNCTALGQNPGTAFPVCGSSLFSQTTVPICGDRNVPTPCTSSQVVFQDKNPYWYKFTCFSAGTLGFVITPNNQEDDYDWQIFDITGHDPKDVYTDQGLFVACNWSGEPGQTGASSIGQSLKLCEGPGVSLFGAMPQLQQGHNYLLLVSHFTNSQSGYSLEFKYGTASITDTTPPMLQRAKVLCDNTRISVKLNKKMKCNTLAADGSDFTISDPSVAVLGVSAPNCSTGFDMDSLIITLNGSLAPGNYSLTIKSGSDANTLLDNCDAAIPNGDKLSFAVLPSQPAAFDSIGPVGCAPDELTLVFSDPLLCSSVAADGSDFTISGSTATVVGASTVCSDNASTIIKLRLSAPIVRQGTYQVTLQAGSDGNTVINECSLATPAGAAVSFSTQDIVSADFDYTIAYGCKADTGKFFHPGGNSVNQWSWQFGNNAFSPQQNPVYTFPVFGDQIVKLTVSNGTCTDSSAVTFNLDNELKADFTLPVSLCPQDAAIFKDTSIGKIISYEWNFGNGITSALKDPPAQTYPVSGGDKMYPVRLIIKNDRNCADTANRKLEVLYNCFIGVASAFTPNSDGLNDYLYPINAYKAKNLIFKVYNRFGQLVFQTTNFTVKWDGTFKGIPQQTGTYVWTLQYTNIDTGKFFSSKGTSVLIR